MFRFVSGFIGLLLALFLVLGITGCAQDSSSSSSSSSSTTSSSSSSISKSTSSSSSASSSSSVTESPVETYSKKMQSYGTQLSGLLTSGTNAMINEDYSKIAGYHTQSETIYNSIMKMSVPAGYDDVQNGYIEFAYDVRSFLNYCDAAATAAKSGDQNLYEYYLNLAADESDNATAASQALPALIAAAG